MTVEDISTISKEVTSEAKDGMDSTPYMDESSDVSDEVDTSGYEGNVNYIRDGEKHGNYKESSNENIEDNQIPVKRAKVNNLIDEVTIDQEQGSEFLVPIINPGEGTSTFRLELHGIHSHNAVGNSSSCASSIVVTGKENNLVNWLLKGGIISETSGSNGRTETKTRKNQSKLISPSTDSSMAYEHTDEAESQQQLTSNFRKTYQSLHLCNSQRGSEPSTNLK
ncbi:hypothetical protein JTB14_016570 [Gonioctena quinquepunctata]|nr:hypothetical protein JTB14_016570 [Gonioctena quinquepunctata]